MIMINELKTLMLGDLIYNHRKWVCPVIGLNKDSITVIAQHYGESTYRREDNSAIPLTEEIILELGWEKLKESDEDFKRGIGKSNQYKHPWYTKTLMIVQNSLTDMYKCVDGEIVLRYVHDLQHVLHHTVEDEIRYDWENKKFYLYSPEYHYSYDKKNGVKRD